MGRARRRREAGRSSDSSELAEPAPRLERKRSEVRRQKPELPHGRWRPTLCSESPVTLLGVLRCRFTRGQPTGCIYHAYTDIPRRKCEGAARRAARRRGLDAAAAWTHDALEGALLGGPPTAGWSNARSSSRADDLSLTGSRSYRGGAGVRVRDVSRAQRWGPA